MNIKLGDKIKTLQKTHNLPQEKLAEYLGVSFQAVSKWENNIAFPDISLIPTLANFFGIIIDDIFGFDLKEVNDKVNAICEEVYRYRQSDPSNK